MLIRLRCCLRQEKENFRDWIFETFEWLNDLASQRVLLLEDYRLNK